MCCACLVIDVESMIERVNHRHVSQADVDLTLSVFRDVDKDSMIGSALIAIKCDSRDRHIRIARDAED